MGKNAKSSMDHLAPILNRAKKITDFNDVGTLIDEHHKFLFDHAMARTGMRIPWIDYQEARFTIKSGFIRFDRDIPGWACTFKARLTNGGPIMRKLVKDMMEILPMKIIAINGVASLTIEANLSADDWSQMLMYRRLMDIDTY